MMIKAPSISDPGMIDMRSEPEDEMDTGDSTLMPNETVSGTSANPPASPMDPAPPASASLPLETTSDHHPQSSIPTIMRPMTMRPKKGVKIGPGLWLAAGISPDYLVNGVPIVGVINECGFPRPSLRGCDIWPTEETIEEITWMAEANDWAAIKEAKSVFHLGGPQKNQLRDAYIWIAFRRKEDGSFFLSESTRDRIVPTWRELLSSCNDSHLPTVVDLRQRKRAMAGNDIQMASRDILERSDGQTRILDRLLHQMERQTAAIDKLAVRIGEEAPSNQEVV